MFFCFNFHITYKFTNTQPKSTTFPQKICLNTFPKFMFFIKKFSYNQFLLKKVPVIQWKIFFFFLLFFFCFFFVARFEFIIIGWCTKLWCIFLSCQDRISQWITQWESYLGCWSRSVSSMIFSTAVQFGNPHKLAKPTTKNSWSSSEKFLIANHFLNTFL